jgi:predicted esterase
VRRSDVSITAGKFVAPSTHNSKFAASREARGKQGDDMIFGILARVAAIAWMLAATHSGGIAQPAAAAPEVGADGGTTIWVTTRQRLKTKVYESAGRGASPILVVVVHGDSPSQSQTYQYQFAKAAAAAIPDAVVAAVLRPGYDDGEERSDGMRGETTGDNYTPEVLDAVATAISELKARYQPRRLVLVGHSGGSAIVGSLIGQRGGIANAALLVSCVCDLEAWRKHMQATKGGKIWERPVRSLSPLALVNGISASTRVSMLVGSDDETTPPSLTEAYAAALRDRGIPVDVMVAPGLQHNILLTPVALERLKQIVSTTSAAQ